MLGNTNTSFNQTMIPPPMTTISVRTHKSRKRYLSEHPKFDFINPQKRINNKHKVQFTNKQNDESLQLPKIKAKTIDKMIIQQWLDESLSHGVEQNDKIRAKLSNIREFELDSKYLKDQDISKQAIEKIHRALLIYSAGINSIFGDILQLVNNGYNQRIMHNFWKAYNKLLQGCTNYQNVFQKVQQQYLRQVQFLRSNAIRMNQQFIEQINKDQATISELRIQSQRQQVEYKNLQEDWKVVSSNLDLTDTVMNEQVTLRLKFEQRINLVHCSYKQIRHKYEEMREELKIMNKQIEKMKIQEKNCKAKLVQQRKKVTELQFMLQSQRQKMMNCKEQLTIKEQQYFQQTEKTISLKFIQNQKEDKTISYVNTIHGLKSKIQNQSTINANLNQEVKQFQKQSQRLIVANERAHKQNNQQSLQNKRIIEIKINCEQTIEQQKATIHKLQNKQNKLNQTNQQLQVQLQSTININEELKKEVESMKIKNNRNQRQITSLLSSIQELKGIKDKYERTNELLNRQVIPLNEQITQYQATIKIKEEEYIKLKKLQLQFQEQIERLKRQKIVTEEKNSKESVQYEQQIAKRDAIIKKYKLSQLSNQTNNQLKDQIQANLKCKVDEIYLISRMKQNQLNELKEKIIIYQKESNRNKALKEQIQNYQSQIGELKMQYTLQKSTLHQNQSNSQYRIQTLQIQLNKLNNKLLQTNPLINKMQFQDYEAQILRLEDHKLELQMILQNYSTIINEQKGQIKHKQTQITYQNEIIIQNGKQTTNIKNKCQSEVKIIQKQLNEQKYKSNYRLQQQKKQINRILQNQQKMQIQYQMQLNQSKKQIISLQQAIKKYTQIKVKEIGVSVSFDQLKDKKQSLTIMIPNGLQCITIEPTNYLQGEQAKQIQQTGNMSKERKVYGKDFKKAYKLTVMRK